MPEYKIILTNGPGPTAILTVDPPLVDQKILFAQLDEAFVFARFLNEVTGWPVIDRVDSLPVEAPKALP